MDFDFNFERIRPFFVLLTLVIGLSALGVTALDMTSEDEVLQPDKNYSDISGDRVKFNFNANSSDVESIDVEAGYMRVDDMYELDSPEIELESETCIRFYNYSGSVNLADKSLNGNAEGFATCTLNASIGLTVDEKVQGMKKVSLERVSAPTDLDLEVRNLEFYTGNFPTEINQSNTTLSIRDYEGYITFYPPNGITMDGTGTVKVGNKTITKN